MANPTPETFLELCQAAVRESGMATGGGALPATVANQVNVLGKMVARVAEAWAEIQGEKKWDFLRGTKTFPLIVTQRSYSIEGTNVGELNWQDLSELDAKSAFVITRASDGSKALLTYRPWRKWRELYAVAVTWPVGIPSEFTIDQGLNVVFNATPDAAHSIELPYWKQPTVLAADSDKPAIHKNIRPVIYWRAVRKFAEDKNDMGRKTRAESEESRHYHMLMRAYLPPVTAPPNPITGP